MKTDEPADKIKALTAELNTLGMQNRDEVEQFIRIFKTLIYNHKMIGLLHDYYLEDIRVIRENRVALDGLDALIRDTTEFLAYFPDMAVHVDTVIVKGSEQEGYKIFCRARYTGSNLGSSPYGLPTGKALGEGCMELSMLSMKKTSAGWKITDEMVMISRELIESTLKD